MHPRLFSFLLVIVFYAAAIFATGDVFSPLYFMAASVVAFLGTSLGGAAFIIIAAGRKRDPRPMADKMPSWVLETAYTALFALLLLAFAPAVWATEAAWAVIIFYPCASALRSLLYPEKGATK